MSGGDKLGRDQANLQLRYLIKVPKHIAAELLPDREILSVADVEAAAAKFRDAPSHWLSK